MISDFATKIGPVQARQDLLIRHRLLRRLHSYVGKKGTVIQAPAGYGKTSLLAQFTQDIEIPVCWLSLDESDRIPGYLLRHLFASIVETFPVRIQDIDWQYSQVGGPSSGWEDPLATLVANIHHKIPEMFILILDDLHIIDDQTEAIALMDALVSHLPENVYLIISSRTKPPLPSLPRLTVNREIGRLSANQLRFTTTEVRQLFKLAYEKEISTKDAEEITEATAGWIAGINLVAEHNQPDRWTLADFQFDEYWFDYLAIEVLGQQPREVQEFLLDICILAFLEPQLCNDVAQINNSDSLLNQLLERNLFLSSISKGLPVYKLHQLFRDFLIQRLIRDDPDRLQELYGRAGLALERRNRIPEAIQHYIAAGRQEELLTVLEREHQSLLERGYFHELEYWLGTLPSSTLENHPVLLLCRARVAIQLGEQDAGLKYCTTARETFEKNGNIHGQVNSLLTASAALRQKGMNSEALDLSKEALSRLINEPSDANLRADALKHLGISLNELGKFSKAFHALEEALIVYESVGDIPGCAEVRISLGQICATTGDLTTAVVHFEQAREAWSRLNNKKETALITNNIGVLYHMRGEIDLAERTLQQAHHIAEEAGSVPMQAYALTSLGDMKRDLGELGEALQLYYEGLELAKKGDQRSLIVHLLSALSIVHKLGGDLDRSEAFARQSLVRAASLGSYEEALSKRILGDVLSHRGRYQEARDLLCDSLTTLELSHAKQGEAQALFSLARLYHSEGDMGEAKSSLYKLIGQLEELKDYSFLVLEATKDLPLLEYAVSNSVAEPIYYKLLNKARNLRVKWDKPVPDGGSTSLPSVEGYGLGPGTILSEGREIGTSQWESKKAVEMLFYFLYNMRELRKEEVIEALWPEALPEKGNSSFQTTMYRIRRALYRDVIVHEGSGYRLNPDGAWWMDSREFMRLVEAAQIPDVEESELVSLLEEAAKLYKGPLLEAFDSEWIADARDKLLAQYMNILTKLSFHYLKNRQYSDVVKVCRGLLEESPYDESALTNLLKAHMALGDREIALKIYKKFTDQLAEDLGVGPSPVLTNLRTEMLSRPRPGSKSVNLS